MKWWKKVLFSATFRTIVGIILSEKSIDFENFKISVINSSQYGFIVRFEYVDITKNLTK